MRISSSSSTSSLATPTPALVQPSGNSFLAMLTSASEEDNSGSGNGAAATATSSDQGNGSSGEGSGGQENGEWTNAGSPGIANGAGLTASSNKTGTDNSSAANVSSSAPPSPMQAGSFGVASQSTLTNVWEEGAFGSSSAVSGAKLHGAASASNRTAGKQAEAKQPSLELNGSAVAPVEIPTADQVSASAIQLQGGQANGELSGTALQGSFASGTAGTISAISWIGTGLSADAGESSAGRPAIESDKLQALTLSGNDSLATALAGEKANVQLNAQAASDSTSGISAQAANVQASNSIHDVPRQLLASQLAQEIPASERTATQAKQLNLTAPHAATGGGDSAAPIVSSGLPNVDASIVPLAGGEMFPGPMDLSMPAALLNRASSGQSIGNALQKSTIDAAGSKNSGLVQTADAGSSKSADAVGGSGVGSAHNAQNNGQPAQNTQVDPAQVATIVQKGVESSAVQVQAVVSQVTSHDTATAHRVPDGIDSATRPNEQQEVPAALHADGGEAVAASGINLAKLMQTMSETEMRVGMHSSEFGDISIRTSVSQQQMVAQISLDHSDLSQAISSHVFTVQTKLGDEYGLHASIEINNLGSSLSGGQEQSSQRDQGSFTRSIRFENGSIPAEEDSGVSMGALISAGNGNRLDIRA